MSKKNNKYFEVNFGLVGESGSGKSTTGRTIINLYNATAGQVLFEGKDIQDKKNGKEMMRREEYR